MILDIPGYTTKKMIAQGGMGTVYTAVQNSLDRLVAIKILTPGMGSNAQYSERFLERFMLEGRIIASLSHTNIVSIYDFGTLGDDAYLVMEYLPRGDLKQKMERHEFSLRESLNLMMQIAKALCYAHQRQIVHRDVKPANILFRSGGTPVLTDFGVAKMLGSDKELTHTQNALGSPYYISPEQARDEAVDGRADLYSLGVVLYEMLTGKRLFNAESALGIVIKHIEEPVPRLPSGLRQLQPLLDRMLAKDPKQRFRDAAELARFIRDIKDSLSDHPNYATRTLKRVKKKSPHKNSPTKNSSGPRRLGLATLITGLVAITVGIATALFLPGKNYMPLDFGINQTITKSPTNNTNVKPEQRRPLYSINPGYRLDPSLKSGKEKSRPETTNEVSDDYLANLARSKKVENMLTKAATSISQNYWIFPQKENAHFYYSEVLKIAPSNKEATRGIQQIANHFVTLAERSLREGDKKKAKIFVKQGLKVQPTHHSLIRLNQEL